MSRNIKAYKLVRVRKDGTLGPLFIDKGLDYVLNKWLTAKAVKTTGFAFRPGFHCCAEPSAPHLTKKDRVWCEVLVSGVTKHKRPESQGGLWYTAKKMKIVKILSGTQL